MKYTTVINNAGVVNSGLHHKTDLNDWAILDYIKDWQSHPKSERRGNLVWINYSHLLAEMPLLAVKHKSGVANRIKKLKEFGLLETEQCLTTSRLFAVLMSKTPVWIDALAVIALGETVVFGLWWHRLGLVAFVPALENFQHVRWFAQPFEVSTETVNPSHQEIRRCNLAEVAFPLGHGFQIIPNPCTDSLASCVCDFQY